MGLRDYLQARRVGKSFPKEKEHFWYCGEIYTYANELREQGKPWRSSEMELPCDRFIINPFSDSGGKIPKDGDILPCIKVDGWIGFYQVSNRHMYSSAGSDFASWDDGYSVDLKFHHCEKETMIV